MQDSSPVSTVHVLRGQKADNWWLRQCPKVMELPFKDGIKRADRDNAIDLYIGEEYMDVLADGAWENIFTEKPEVFTREEKRAWLDKLDGRFSWFPTRSSRSVTTLSAHIRAV